MRTKSLQSLKGKLQNKAHGLNIETRYVMRNYIMECFLHRLYKSEHKRDFILTGGFLLTKIFGEENRSTKDLDTVCNLNGFSQESLQECLDEVCDVACEDDFDFSVKNIREIVLDKKAEGYTCMIEARYEKMIFSFYIDVVDNELYQHVGCVHTIDLTFDDEQLDILGYSLEQVLADKIETVIERGVDNTRYKDFYDLVYLTRKVPNIDYKKVLDRVENKLNVNLGISLSAVDTKQLLNDLRGNSHMIDGWDRWKAKTFYVDRDITFCDTLDVAQKICNKINTVTQTKINADPVKRYKNFNNQLLNKAPKLSRA